ncbi:outer membrane protein assembly factor BamA [Candidatus Pelagibacter sp.]|nr:outer membrane protein assembly factor BamA [Candidatus Pelagibacter sp.]
MLNNHYLNNGYYDVKVNTSFAKLISDGSFELIFNIQANKKYYFNNIKLKISDDYSKDNFAKIFTLFDKIKGEPYSINTIDDIADLIDEVVISEQFESIAASVSEQIDENKINMVFEVKESEKFFVERINIFGNNVTEEKVIRNQLLIDEGDPFNEILKTKSINNIKNLNFFRKVESKVISSNDINNKIINITVEEKPTGEITAGAGVGTEGSTIMAGVRENNFLGKGISLNTQLKLSEEDIKGNFTISNPNFKNSDKSVFLNIQALETDRMSSSGYKTNKTGFTVGTDFEYYDDLNFGIGNSNYYEKISTDSTASARQQSQKGNYWDSFLNLNFTQDKRNQKFQATRGYLSKYNIDIPIISDTNSFINNYSYKYFSELFDNNISTIGFSLGSAFSLNDSDIKLSERLFIPSSRLRGFEGGKVGPKDGNDFVGGNYLATLNLTSSIPQILPNSQDTDFSFFIDVANIWGVDYDSSLNDSGKIRSSIGIGLDWFTVIGPISFSYAQPLSKDNNDVTQEFSFNLGTTF